MRIPGNSPLAMPAEHVDALQKTDLQLSFDVHGALREIPGYGLATVGVTDSHYERLATVVQSLNPGRGDTLVTELIGFNAQDTDVGDFVNQLAGLKWRSGYLDKSKSIDVGDTPKRGFVQLSQSHYANASHIEELASQIRRFRITHPDMYAQALAVAKGVPYTHADANDTEMQEWREVIEGERKRLGSLGRLVMGDRFWLDLETSYRDRKMVQRLGERALSMHAADPNDLPRLAFSAGLGHKRGVRRILKANGVPFTVNLDVSVTAHPLQYAARYVAPFINTTEQARISAWKENAEREASL